MKTTKRALLMSMLALVLSFSMLLGTTFAWFTDTASSNGNKVIAGTLNVDLLMHDGTDYVDISETSAPIFGNDQSLVAQNNNADTLWEPGKTQVAYLAIRNNGNLALKYTVSLVVRNVAKDLYKVMEYIIVPDAEAGDTVAWDDAQAKTVVVGSQTVSNGEGFLKSESDTHYFALMIHMDELAGNEYMAGEVDFDLVVYAAQLNSEEDFFGSSYDIGAEYDTPSSSTPSTPTLTVSTAADLQAALTPTVSNDAAIVNIMSDITLADGETWTPLDLDAYSNTVRNIVINGNGHTISGLNNPLIGRAYFGNTSIEINDLTLADVEVTSFTATNELGIGAFIAWADNTASVVLNNCHLKDSTVTSTLDFTGIGGLIGYSSSKLIITDCSVTGCTITGTQNSAGAIAGHVSAGHDTTITNAKVVRCTVKGERTDKTGYVVGTANNGATTITLTEAECTTNTVFDVANSTTIYGRLSGGTLKINGVEQQ